MNKSGKLATSLLLASTVIAAAGAGPARAAGVAADKSADSPDSVIVTEEWWYPLRMDSADALAHARFLYRRNNEREAAEEVRRAASWLSFAANHALSHTSQALLSARTDLLTLADDLDTGKVAGAARMDEALSQASSALAQWHYYRARDELGKSDVRNAVGDLQAAASHLENAAESAHLEYGPDTIHVFEDIYRNGKYLSEGKTVDNNMLGKHLDTIEDAIETMANALK
ncbi:MAG: hypothetical protein PVG24_05915 [Gammaproteobacteria bacterium]|jgi:hypothetical protein